jgi:RimJ/RimL family protein N-acetyltransferase
MLWEVILAAFRLVFEQQDSLFLFEVMEMVTERRNLFTIVEYFHKHLGSEDGIMEISIEKATNLDADAIFDIQVKAFKPLLEKYKDYETNPANENLERVYTRINYPNGGFYKILANNIIVGAIRVFWKEDEQFWISPMFILPEYQGKGFAQKAIILIEGKFPQAVSWELATILEEERNCYLYEKMGYTKTGVNKQLNENTTLIFYKKVC